jgi:Holliday junction resolvase RusA-like endonuclease
MTQQFFREVMQWRFFVEGLPIAQPRTRSTASGRHYTPDNGIHKWKRSLQFVARQHYHGKKIEGPFRVDLLFVFPRPKSIQWKTKPMPQIWHIKKPDRDNLDKAVLDALTGIFWHDDCQVCSGTIDKQIADGDSKSGVEVFIYKLEGMEV